MQTQSFDASVLISAMYAGHKNISRPSGLGTWGRIFSMVTCLLVLLVAGAFPVNAQTPAVAAKHEHDKWKTEPRELFFEYEAFCVSFDGPDDDDADGTEDRSGVPVWVSYDVRKKDKEHLAKRPK